MELPVDVGWGGQLVVLSAFMAFVVLLAWLLERRDKSHLAEREAWLEKFERIEERHLAESQQWRETFRDESAANRAQIHELATTIQRQTSVIHSLLLSDRDERTDRAARTILDPP